MRTKVFCQLVSAPANFDDIGIRSQQNMNGPMDAIVGRFRMPPMDLTKQLRTTNTCCRVGQDTERLLLNLPSVALGHRSLCQQCDEVSHGGQRRKRRRGYLGTGPSVFYVGISGQACGLLRVATPVATRLQSLQEGSPYRPSDSPLPRGPIGLNLGGADVGGVAS